MTTSTILDSEVRKLADIAKAHGWRIDKATNGHPRFWPPDGKTPPIVTSGTSSDWRAIRNFRADLKRAGLPLDVQPDDKPAPRIVGTPSPANAPQPKPRAFGDALRDARMRAGLSHSDLAALLDTNQTSIMRYERGDHVPRAKLFERMAKDFPELRGSDWKPPHGRPLGSKNKPREPMSIATTPTEKETIPMNTPSSTPLPQPPPAQRSMGEALRFLAYLRETPERAAVLERLRAADAQAMTLAEVIDAMSA